MGGYNSNPDLAAMIRAQDKRIADLQRQVQQKTIPMAQLTRPSNFSASSTEQRFPFTDVDFDTAGMRDAANPQVLTIPFDGVYLVAGSVQWDGIGTSEMRAAIIKRNGSDARGTFVIDASDSTTCHLAPNTILRCDKDDEISLWVQHGIADPNINMVGIYCSLSVAWLGVG